MPPETSTKLDVTSSALEKGIEVARDFVNKLIMPATEEAGLLVKDSVSFWRFKNQVRMLQKAKAYCEKNGIEPGTVSPKLLAPLLDGAGLEDDPVLQDKWAILLSNLVDSDQNIQNHVFPYILGQISSEEFLVLEKVFQDMRSRVADIRQEIEDHKVALPGIEAELSKQIEQATKLVEVEKAKGTKPFDRKVWDLQREQRRLESELRMAQLRERRLLYGLSRPQEIPEDSLREFEMSNIMRLGLARHVQETYAEPTSVDLPDQDMQEFGRTLDIEMNVVTDSSYILTELGALFMAACTEKGDV